MATVGTTVTVGDSPSGVTYNVANRIIPNSQAGIGDILFMNTSGTIIAMSGKTYTSTPSGYYLLGVIYGFEMGQAMVLAKENVYQTSISGNPNPKWADNSGSTLSESTNGGNVIDSSGFTGTISTAGKPRNCKDSSAGNQTYLAMNIARVKQASGSAISSNTKLHPTHMIWGNWTWEGSRTSAQMPESSFNSDTNGAKTLYGTYEAYLSQCMPMGNGGGGCFDKKYHHGKAYTKALGVYSASSLDDQSLWYPAAYYCYNYCPSGLSSVSTACAGNWWLPDMVELLQMMKDSTYNAVNIALAKCGTTLNNASYCWSSVRYSSTYAWRYNDTGISNNNNFYNSLICRPVSRSIKKRKTNREMDIETLKAAYLKSRKHNRRSQDQVEFEMNLYGRLTTLCAQFNSRTFVPLHCYTFIHQRQKKREVFAAEVELKIIQCYIDMRIRPLVEAELCDRTFNNRKGMGSEAAINRVMDDIFECSEGYTKPCWIIKWDLQGYFPNINQDIAFSRLMDLLKDYKGDDMEDLLYALNISCYCNPQYRCFRKSPITDWGDYPLYKSLFSKPFGTGAAIGFLFWQLTSNLYLSDCDKWCIEWMSKYYVRFVDDCVVVTSDKDRVLQLLPTLRDMYGEIDVTMHPRKFYCQQYWKGMEFLGLHIKPYRLHLNRKIVDKAYGVVKDNCKADRFVCRVNTYLGMIKAGTDTGIAWDLLDSIKRKDVVKDYVKLKIKQENMRLKERINVLERRSA